MFSPTVDEGRQAIAATSRFRAKAVVYLILHMYKSFTYHCHQYQQLIRVIGFAAAHRTTCQHCLCVGSSNKTTLNRCGRESPSKCNMAITPCKLKFSPKATEKKHAHQCGIIKCCRVCMQVISSRCAGPTESNDIVSISNHTIRTLVLPACLNSTHSCTSYSVQGEPEYRRY